MGLNKQALLLLLFISNAVTLLCTFPTPNDREFNTIVNVKAKNFGMTSVTILNTMRAQANNYVDPELKSLCSKELNKQASDWVQPRFLGSGSFGAAFKVILDQNAYAVKLFSFYEYMGDQIDEYSGRYGMSFTLNTCNNDMLIYLRQENTLVADSENSLELKIENTKMESLLSTQNFKNCPEDQKIARKEFLDDLQKKIDSQVAEIELNDYLSKYSQENENQKHASFLRFDKCFVDSHFNIYIKTELLSNTFQAARSACQAYFGKSLVSRVIFNMRLIYKVFILHQLGYSHCDIKLANIAFKSNSDFQEFNFIDFGLATKHAACKLGATSYLPPEIRQGISWLPNNLTKFNTPHYFQTDAFSLGLVLLKISVNYEGHQLINTNYDAIFSSEAKGNIEARFKTFYELITSQLDKTRDGLYGSVMITKSQDEKDNRRIEKLMHHLIEKLLDRDITERFPVRLALLVIYEIYLLAIRAQTDIDAIENLLQNPATFITRYELKNVSGLSQAAPGMTDPSYAATVADAPRYRTMIEGIRYALNVARFDLI